MITPESIALIPSAPFLLDGLDGEQSVGREIRAAALSCIEKMLHPDIEQIVVVAQHETCSVWPESAPTGSYRFGGMHPMTKRMNEVHLGEPLPLGLAVGRTLIESTGYAGKLILVSVCDTISPEEASAIAEWVGSAMPSAILLVGSGSACCDAKAPGWERSDSEQFNNSLVAAIEGGTHQLLDLGMARANLSDIGGPMALLSLLDTRNVVLSQATSTIFRGVFYAFANWTAARECSD